MLRGLLLDDEEEEEVEGAVVVLWPPGSVEGMAGRGLLGLGGAGSG
jgi:hypothetical protein